MEDEQKPTESSDLHQNSDSELESDTECLVNQEDEIVFSETDNCENIIKKKKIEKWRVIKIHANRKEKEEKQQTGNQSTYLQRQREKQTLTEENQDSKAAKLEKIYKSEHKPSYIVQVLPNPDFVPDGWPRKQFPGSMPSSRGRFHYTCNAYGRKEKDVKKLDVSGSSKKKKKAGKSKPEQDHKDDADAPNRTLQSTEDDKNNNVEQENEPIENEDED